MVYRVCHVLSDQHFVPFDLGAPSACLGSCKSERIGLVALQSIVKNSLRSVELARLHIYTLCERLNAKTDLPC